MAELQQVCGRYQASHVDIIQWVKWSKRKMCLFSYFSWSTSHEQCHEIGGNSILSFGGCRVNTPIFIEVVELGCLIANMSDSQTRI